LDQGKAAILMNHGLLTVGGTVDEAAYLFTLMERSCQIQLLTEGKGLMKNFVTEEEAAYNFKMASTPVSNFPTYYSNPFSKHFHCEGYFILRNSATSQLRGVQIQRGL
jgi:hypothetical protein